MKGTEISDQYGQDPSSQTPDGSTAAPATDSAAPAAATDGDTSANASADDSSAGSSASDGNSSASGSAPSSDQAAGQDPGQPYLLVDLYSGDDGRLVGKTPNWATLAQTSGFVGAILKAWDGASFNDGGWFDRHWPAVHDAGGARYGASWFRGAYLFVEFGADGTAQADAYLAAIDAAGGWDSGDLLPIIDVELGGAKHPNRAAGKQQIIDCVTACANEIKSKTGRRVILYGRGAMRDLGIVDKMGCDLVWNPAYTANMVSHGLEAWSPEDIVLWQYCGDGQGFVAKLPTSIQGFGACDISVFVKGSQTPDLQMVKDNLLN